MSKEAVVIVLDVGPSMRNYAGIDECHLDKAKFAVRKLLMHKLMFTKRDEIGVVLVGTKKTDHSLKTEESDLDGYEHIYTMRNIAKPDLKLVEQLSTIEDTYDPAPNGCGDILDGIVVAMKMIRERVGKLKFTKKIYVLSDAAVEIDRGSVDVIERAMVLGEFKLNFIGMDFDDNFDSEDDELEGSSLGIDRNVPETPDEYKQKVQDILDASAAQGVQRTQIMAENELFLRKFVRNVNGALLSCSTAEELLTAFCSKAVLQVSKMRGYLQVGLDPAHKERIAVWTYGKTAAVNLPSLKRMSVAAEAALKTAAATAALKPSDMDGGPDNDEDDFQTVPRGSYQSPDDKADDAEDVDMDVSPQMVRVYTRPSDPTVVVDDASQGRAFRYGADYVPIADSILPSLKLEWNKGITILAFIPATAISRHDFIGTCDVVIPEPGKSASACAVSALTRAMIEKNVIAVVKYVKRQNANPILGVLTPTVLDTVDCWFLNQIPFTEDIRDYSFPSLAHRVKPTHDQKVAAESLIMSMSLDEATVIDENGDLIEFDELYKPPMVFNPALQRFYQLVETRAFDPTCSLEFALSPEVAGAALPAYDAKEIWRPGFPPLRSSSLATADDLKSKDEYRETESDVDTTKMTRIDSLIASHPRITVLSHHSQLEYKAALPVERRVFDATAQKQKPHWRDYLNFGQQSESTKRESSLPESSSSRYAFKQETDVSDMATVISTATGFHSTATSSSGFRSTATSSSAAPGHDSLFSLRQFLSHARESVPSSYSISAADPTADISEHMLRVGNAKITRPYFALSAIEHIFEQTFDLVRNVLDTAFSDAEYDQACGYIAALRSAIWRFVASNDPKPATRSTNDSFTDMDQYACKVYNAHIKTLRDAYMESKPAFWEIFQSNPSSVQPLTDQDFRNVAAMVPFSLGIPDDTVDAFWNGTDKSPVVEAPPTVPPPAAVPASREDDMFEDLE